MPFKQNMGSKENDSPGNFSNKDNKTISNSAQSKMSRNDIKSFIQSQAPKKTEVVGSSGGLSVIGGLVSGGVKAAGKLYSAFSNASKQYAKHGANKTIALRNAGVKSSKDMRYADKSWTASAIKNNQKGIPPASTKQVPIVGKPGKTTSVSASSSTKQVSYANPRISMTQAQRNKAGY